MLSASGQPASPDDPLNDDARAESSAKSRKWLRRRLWSRISIQSKLLVMLLVTSVLSAAVVGFIGYRSGQESLRASAFDRLTEIRGAQTRLLQTAMRLRKDALVVYTRGSTTEDAMREFTAGFDQLNDARISPQQQQAIVDYYTKNAGVTFGAANGGEVDIDALLPKSNAQRYLQAYYTAPFDDIDAAIKVDDARDGSAWSAANARFNQFFRPLVTRFQFADAMLIDPRGNVVYTAYKDVDLGTNILTGPYRGSNLTEAFEEAMDSNSLDYVASTDFGDYQPTEEPVRWMVSPIGPAANIQGVLALQVPISLLERAMTFDSHWEAAGLGKTGETILTGPDELMRSNSRLFLEDPEAWRQAAVAAGTPAEVADRAVRQGSTTLVVPAATEATHLALQGQSGTLIAEDYDGHDTLQAYAPSGLEDLDWTIVAKIRTSEAFAPVAAFTRTLIISTVVIIFVVCLAAMLLARLFVRPIRRLESGAQRISAGEYDVALPVTSSDEFGDVTHAFNEMSRSLRTKEQLLNEQRQENDRLLLSLMPEQVVRRYRNGEENIGEDHQDVAVIYADIVGLEELANELTADQSLAAVNSLVRQFDAAAENLGVEKVRTFHNSYLASCGLNVPRLDNVRRTVDFAVEMRRIVDRFNAETGNQLRLRAGIATGTVTSGLVGRTSLAYDLWGRAVNLAYRVQSGSSEPGVYVTSGVFEAARSSKQFTPASETMADGTAEPVWRLSEQQ